VQVTVRNRDLVVVGASAGGVEALRDLARDLPGDLPATVLIVLHLPTSAYSAMPAILNRAGQLSAMSAYDGAPLKPGTILIAPPDRHLLVRDDHVVLGLGPKENGHRPAIDPLFRSAARWRGDRTVGLVMTGTLDDGAAGLATLVERGAVAVVQDPRSALYDGMPCAALRAVPDAITASGQELAHRIAGLCSEDITVNARPPDPVLEMETGIPALDEPALADANRPGRPAAMTCPDCSGAMFVLDEGSFIRYRCRVGHAWSPETLLTQQWEATETALWAAIRTLEEKAALHRGLAERSRGTHLGHGYHVERAAEATASAAVLRDILRRPIVHPEADHPSVGDHAG
jgi:two-component system, chemotaxis family, protein-glutamate methylesterase/glutaminase